MSWVVTVSNKSSESLAMSMGDERKLYNLNKLGGQFEVSTASNKKRRRKNLLGESRGLEAIS
jgi:hypothetical protein